MYIIYIWIYFCIFIGLGKLGMEKTKRTSLFTEDATLVDEDEFLSMLQGSILIISPTDSLTDVPSTPTPEIINKGNLYIEKVN